MLFLQGVLLEPTEEIPLSGQYAHHNATAGVVDKVDRGMLRVLRVSPSGLNEVRRDNFC